MVPIIAFQLFDTLEKVKLQRQMWCLLEHQNGGKNRSPVYLYPERSSWRLDLGVGGADVLLPVYQLEQKSHDGEYQCRAYVHIWRLGICGKFQCVLLNFAVNPV